MQRMLENTPERTGIAATPTGREPRSFAEFARENAPVFGG
jgi:hypothetical protein